MEDLFFELLQVAIGTRDKLRRVPTALEWRQLFELSKKQALTAVAFRGLCRLKDSDEDSRDFGGGIGVDEVTYLKWLGVTAKIAQRNKVLSDACTSLCKDLAHDGLYACILKGQSNLVNYPEELRDCRTPGDIDVWCSPMDPCGIDIAIADIDGKGAHYEKYAGERGVIEWVLAGWRLMTLSSSPCLGRECHPDGKSLPLSRGNEGGLPEVNYHHIDWEYKGVECEVHFKPSWMNNPFHNARLQKWCKDNEQWNTCEYQGFNIPSVGFNAVYQLVHIYRHLFNEGIGLRQLQDYYFVLRALHIEQGELSDRTDKMQQWASVMGKNVPSNEEVMHKLSRLGMKSFASAVMYVLQKVFAMPSEYLLCPPDVKRGEFLLNEIMLAGNFGKYDSRNVIGTNEGYLTRFIRRQKRFIRFLTQYPSEVIWGPFFSIKQRLWRIWHGWR